MKNIFQIGFLVGMFIIPTRAFAADVPVEYVEQEQSWLIKSVVDLALENGIELAIHNKIRELENKIKDLEDKIAKFENEIKWLKSKKSIEYLKDPESRIKLIQFSKQYINGLNNLIEKNRTKIQGLRRLEFT
jgi:hypothetical protein